MSSSVARVTTITSRSKESFEDAIRVGIDRATASLRGIEGAWVKDQTVTIDEGKITTWQVVLEVTFVLDDGPKAGRDEAPTLQTI